MKDIIFIYMIAATMFLASCRDSQDIPDPESMISKIYGTYISTESISYFDIFNKPVSISGPFKQTIEITKTGYYRHSFMAEGIMEGKIKNIVSIEGQLIEDKKSNCCYIQTDKDPVKVEFLTVGHLLFVRYNSGRYYDYYIFHYTDNLACYANDIWKLWTTEAKKIAAHQSCGSYDLRYSITYYSSSSPDISGSVINDWDLNFEFKPTSDPYYCYFATYDENDIENETATDRTFHRHIPCNVSITPESMTLLLFKIDNNLRSTRIEFSPLINDSPRGFYPWDVMAREYPELIHPSKTKL